MTETVSEIRRNEAKMVKKNWHLKNWSKDYKILKGNAKCSVEVEFAPDRPPVKLCFFLDETTTDTDQNLKSFLCASLFVSVEVDIPMPLTFGVTVTLMSDTWQPNGVLISDALVNIASKKDAGRNLVFQEFQRLKTYGHDQESGLRYFHILYGTMPQELRVQIAVTPVFFSDNEPDVTGASGDNASTVAGAEASLSNDLKKMFLSDDVDNLADLKLEMKDNMTLTAHRFVLAARSRFLNARIQKEVKNNDFNGIIKIPEVNSKPMGAILHWMYSGEVEANAGRCMEEVVEAAKKFGLDDLIRVLDKKLIGICNVVNMFDLFKVAQKNGMETAMVELSHFIRESLANLASNRRN